MAGRGWSAWSRCSSRVPDLAFVHLTQRDVVRHRIVADIVAAYERGQRRPERCPVSLDVYRRRRAGGPSGGRRPLVGAGPAGARGRGDRERHRGVAALRRRAGHRRAPRAVPRQGGPDRRPGLPHRGGGRPGRTLARRGGHRARVRTSSDTDRLLMLGDVVDLPGGGRPATPSTTASPSTTRWRCWSSTGSSICSAWTTRSTEEAERMERREQQLLARYYHPVS